MGTSFMRAPHDDRASALGSHEGSGHVETIFGQEVGQVVTGDLALDTAQLYPETCQVVLGELLKLRPQLKCAGDREPIGWVSCAQTGRRGGQLCAVGSDDVNLQHMIRGAAVAY
ncbi:hypothetical protein StoSoilB13_04010 [Arthrobacter sp. StoSoilB13]|nr:hypothetical protein StoSoilB13_04010 [Arthrobacter sp. StoSoilB13]